MDASKLRVIALLTITFAAGTTVGIAADRLGFVPAEARADARADARESDGTRERRGARRPNPRSETTIERFADELRLTVDQRGKIETILERFRKSAHTMWSDVQPRYRSLLDSVRAEIESVLSEQQVDEYRTLLEQRYDRGRDRNGRSDGERRERDEAER